MEIIYAPSIFKHNPKEDFTEGPYRVRGIEKVGKVAKVDFDVLPYIEKVHPKRYIQKIRTRCSSKAIVAEVSTSENTFKASVDSVGLAILASQNQAFAVTRPPGHHAGKEKEAGFCLFNNIAIATKSLIDQGKRVCIIDIDGHHGNGTERIFYSDSRVLYCSIHQEGAYPFNSGNVTNVGSGNGRRFNMNLVVPECSGDDILLRCIRFLKPYVDRFKPDMIGVSAGFDGHAEDRLLALNYSVRGYYDVGNEISSWGYPVFSVLEGGYHSKVVDCIVAFVRGINKESSDLKECSTTSKVNLHKIVESNLLRLEGILSKT